MTQQELKVLLIEDNPGDAFLMKFYLGESTSPVFHVSHSEDVKGGLDLLAKEKFDIILSDMNLPDSFGVDTIKSILTKYPGNLVIVLTGLTDEEVGLETVRYGAQDFLVKGKFDGKVLISSVMFSFERFKLNTQIDSVSKQLDEENSRLDTIQRLLNVGYFEVDTNAGTLFKTDLAHGMLTTGEHQNPAELLGEMQEQLLQEAQQKPTGNYVFECKNNGKKYEIHYEQRNGKICGIVKSAQ